MTLSKKITGWIFATTSLSFIVIAFQNCAGQTGGPSGAYSNSSTSSTTGGASNSSVPTSSTGGVTTIFKAFGATNSQAQIDCSMAPAAMTSLRIEGADADVKLCAEYTLDMPMGAARYGERFLCDSPTKFGAPADDWSYNSDLKIWYANDSLLPNHPVWVPGTYYLVAMNRNGTIVKSQPMVIKRANSTNCWPTSSSSPTAPSAGMTCAWSGNNIVAGPVSGPTQSCTLNNRGATATVDGRSYTCVCR